MPAAILSKTRGRVRFPTVLNDMFPRGPSFDTRVRRRVLRRDGGAVCVRDGQNRRLLWPLLMTQLIAGFVVAAVARGIASLFTISERSPSRRGRISGIFVILC